MVSSVPDNLQLFVSTIPGSSKDIGFIVNSVGLLLPTVIKVRKGGNSPSVAALGQATKTFGF